MTDTANAVARLESVLARLESAGLLAPEVSPMVAVDPDGYPGHVVAGELVESAWGNAVVDMLHIHQIPNSIFGGVDMSGYLRIEGATAVGMTNSTGHIQTMFPIPFIQPPVVIPILSDPTATKGYILQLDHSQVTESYWYGHVSDGAGANVVGISVRVNYVAIGRRGPTVGTLALTEDES